MNTFEMLKKVCESYGPSGREAEVRKTIEKLVKPMGYKCRTDALGNLICHKEGKGARLMFAAHMDSLGMMVTFFEDCGKLRFARVGGLAPCNMVGAPVRFANGIKGTINKESTAQFDGLTADKLFIDIGAESKEEAMSLVSIGDIAVYDNPIVLSANGKFAMGSYLDDRAGCVAQLLAMEKAKDSENDLYFVFTVQEEVGLRGAKTATFAVDPDYMIACDVTRSNDGPKADNTASCASGDGAAIKVMDTSVICHPAVVEKLVELAKAAGIKYCMDVITAGGTDAGAAQLSLDGVPSGGVSISQRYIHAPVEVCSVSDVEDCGALMAEFAKAAF